MPVSSSSMLFTWVTESIILGLIAYAVCEPNYFIYSQLAIAGLVGVLHVAALAADWDVHHSISVSYLCVITSMLVQDSLVPLEGVGSIIRRSFFIIFELAALAMTFTSCTGSTPLFFHKRGHFALLLGVGLEFVRCWNGFIGGGLALAIIAAQCIPTPVVAIIVSGLASVAFAVWGFFQSNWWHLGIGVFIFCISAVSFYSVVVADPSTLPQIAPSAPVMESVNLTPRLMVWPKVRPALFKQS